MNLLYSRPLPHPWLKVNQIDALEHWAIRSSSHPIAHLLALLIHLLWSAAPVCSHARSLTRLLLRFKLSMSQSAFSYYPYLDVLLYQIKQPFMNWCRWNGIQVNKSQYWPLDPSHGGFSTGVMDPRTDGQTDRRTHPLMIEMWGRI